MRDIFMQPGEAMTKWWCKLAGMVLLASAVQPYVEPSINFAKGIAAGSSLCIFIGYYVAAGIYGMYHTPNLVRQLYLLEKFDKHIPFWAYLVLDIGVHVGCTTLVYVVWYKHITFMTTVFAFCFHREWSLVNSNGKTIYLNGDCIYKFKSLPSWGWPTIYVGESCVLIIGMCLACWLRGDPIL